MDDSTYIDKKPSKAKTIWLILVILALVASSVSFTLFYLKQKSEIDTLKAQNSKLADDNKSLESENNKVVVPQGEYRDIPELGVKYKITDENKDLTYQYNLSSGDPDKLELLAVSFKSVFSTPIQDINNTYEAFPYAAIITKYPEDRLNDFNVMGETDINAYVKDYPESVKKVGKDTYVISIPDGGGLNPRAKEALSKQKIVETTLASFVATDS